MGRIPDRDHMKEACKIESSSFSCDRIHAAFDEQDWRWLLGNLDFLSAVQSNRETGSEQAVVLFGKFLLARRKLSS